MEVPVLFSSGRKVFNCSLPLEFETPCCFLQGLYCSLPLDELERRAVFVREEGLLIVFFVVAARPVWNVVPFSLGTKDFIVYYRSTGRLV